MLMAGQMQRTPPECDQLILESLNINYIDESEYPSTTDIQNKCEEAVPTLAHPLHDP